MKKMSRIIFSFILVLSLSSIAFGDIASAVTSLVGNNAESYLAPMGTIIGTNMNSGFYRKVPPHKILGFDITFDVAYSMNPIGQTTYQFIIPDDSVGFSFPFKFPKNLLAPESSPMYNYLPHEGLDNTLYKDREIDFGLSVQDMLDAPDGESQNVFGTGEWDTLVVTLNNAIPQIFNQVIDETWDVAKDIPGIGTEYPLEYKIVNPLSGDSVSVTTTLDPLYSSKEQYGEEFGGPIDSLIRVGLGDMEMPELPIPPGILGETFNEAGLPAKYHGLPLPIVQASVGLPFHTEITVRGLPIEYEIEGVGSIQFGGFGGKIGISNYLSDILYKSEEKKPVSQTKHIKYVINTQPSKINSIDVEQAISDLRLQDIDVHAIDSLNYIFGQGDPTVVIEIQNRIQDAQLQLESMPKSKKKKKKKKKFPIDLSLGYYTNNIKLKMNGPYINSINRMLSLQVGKTFNMPFIPWLGGLGFYGGLGFESSNLDLGYALNNPLDYGCFTGSGDTKQYQEGIVEDNCSGSWETGVPVDISLSFPGENKFRKLIGARMRILFLDAYVDYNIGTSNTINAGVGITIR